MLNSIRQSIKGSVVYGFGNIAVKVVGFLLIPLYTDPMYFSVDDFGIIAVLDITGLILVSLMASGLPQSMMRWYWDKDYSSERKGIFFMSLSLQILISVLFCTFLIPASRTLSIAIFEKDAMSQAIILLIVSSALQAINNLINTLMRVQARSVLFSVANLLKLFTVLGLTIYLITARGMGISGIYLAQVTGNLLFIVFLSGYAIKNSKPYFNGALLKSMSRFGYPLLLANFASAVLAAIDRYALNTMALLKFVAVYTMAYKIASVLKLVIVDSIKMALTPMVLKKMNTTDNHVFYKKSMLYSSFILMSGIIAISLFSYEILKVITKSTSFWSAWMVVPILSISVFFVNMRETTSYGLLIKKNSKAMGLNVVISAVLNIVLNILLIPLWNIYGTAVATLVTQIVYWSLNYHFSQKEYFIPYEQKKVILMFATGAILSFAGLLLNEINLVPRLLLKGLCVAGFPLILYIFNFYEQAELQVVKGLARKWSDIRKLGENLRSLKDTDEDF
jgi:O-antigen/teichoic acid export membrane protein